MKRSGIRGTAVLPVAVLLLLACTTGTAFGSEESELFVREAEPICKANVEANKRIFQGTQKQIKNEELKRASKHFSRAASAFGRTVRELAALPRPSDQAARLDRWFGLLKEVKGLVVKVGKALAAEQKGKATNYGFELRHVSTKANNAVIPLGFNYCRLEPSRFNG